MLRKINDSFDILKHVDNNLPVVTNGGMVIKFSVNKCL